MIVPLLSPGNCSTIWYMHSANNLLPIDALEWSTFVAEWKAKRVAVSVDQSKAARVADEGHLGKGHSAALHFYSLLSILCLLAIVPACIWFRWYYALGLLVLSRLIWAGTKMTASQGVVERCVEDEEFYLACVRSGVVRLKPTV